MERKKEKDELNQQLQAAPKNKKNLVEILVNNRKVCSIKSSLPAVDKPTRSLPKHKALTSWRS